MKRRKNNRHYVIMKNPKWKHTLYDKIHKSTIEENVI